LERCEPKSGFVTDGTTSSVLEAGIEDPAGTIHIIDAMTGSTATGNPSTQGNSIRGIQQTSAQICLLTILPRSQAIVTSMVLTLFMGMDMLNFRVGEAPAQASGLVQAD
jgi:hypothetical protein